MLKKQGVRIQLYLESTLNLYKLKKILWFESNNT